MALASPLEDPGVDERSHTRAVYGDEVQDLSMFGWFCKIGTWASRDQPCIAASKSSIVLLVIQGLSTLKQVQLAKSKQKMDKARCTMIRFESMLWLQCCA